jgi:hypothetical protein
VRSTDTEKGQLLRLPSVWADGEDGGCGCGSSGDGMPRVTWVRRGWDLAGAAKGQTVTGTVDQVGRGAGTASGRRGRPFGVLGV